MPNDYKGSAEIIEPQNSVDTQKTATVVQTKQEEKTENVGVNISGERLLGELLRELRDKQEMKLLMLCREIEKFQIIERCITICAPFDVLEELGGDKAQMFLKKFFASRELSFKLASATDKQKAIDELQKLCGGKLEIK